MSEVMDGPAGNFRRSLGSRKILCGWARNAVDHGIESAEQRQKANKPFSGTVRLDAYHQGNQVVIEVKDDGRGIDPQLITRLGIERGIVAAEEAARLNEAEIIDLIFRP